MIEGKFKGFRFPTLTEQELRRRSEVSGRDVVTPQAARDTDTYSIAEHTTAAAGSGERGAGSKNQLTTPRAQST